ncbi:MAG: hypothetical protein LH473_03980 [Chitinophagales bacterium]|nr:hypothetical protein [Chitinophagales bacterium]
MKNAIVLLAIFITLCIESHAQNTRYLVNKIYEHATGKPDTLDWSASDIDASRNLIIAGNTITTSQGTNLLLTKYDQDGNEIWQKQFNNSYNGNDYGIAITTDASRRIYVAGASYNGATKNYDYVVLKYDSNGNELWHTYYNGTASSYDVCTAILLDASGNVFVTGTSTQTGNLNDYLTIKLNSSGTIQWTKNYDYVHLSDIPAAIVLAANNRIIVSGGSSNSINSWDFTTLKYNAATGAQFSVNRNSTSGSGLDFVTGIAKDANGNFYVTGSAYQTNYGYDMKTIKFDSSLTVLWTKYFDLATKNDGATDIEVDADNNIYITGYGEESNSNREMVTVKYNSSGTQQWVQKFKPLAPFINAEAKKISINPYDAVYITGFKSNGTQKDVVSMSYDLDGNSRWYREWVGANNSIDVPSFIKYDLNNDHIYVCARRTTTDSSNYRVIGYTE